MAETEDTYVGKPIEMFIGDDGSIFVVDAFTNRVIRFGGDGHPIQLYGRHGAGPGEFGLVGTAGAVAGAVVAIGDHYPPMIELFDLDSGDAVGSVSVAVTPRAFGVWQDRIWMAGLDESSDWRTLAVSSVPEMLIAGAEAAPTIRFEFLRAPRPYLENAMIRGVAGGIRLDVKDDVLVGFAASPFLLRVGTDGSVTDTVFLEVRNRRGMPNEDEFIEAMDPARSSQEELIKLASLLRGLARDGDGNIFTVHQDAEFASPERIVAEFFVSSIRADSGVQCVDTRLPTHKLSMPVTAFRGDELFVLEQHLDAGREDGVKAVVRRYLVDVSSCTGMVLVNRHGKCPGYRHGKCPG
ncbi:MAG: hypothetical protein OXK77_14395, partial [Gemmatimonadota bacterium]|nr:hypothetical protein [Gemmatimonadota bacterium]MDE2863575.1 hypothetical protein [Gemmatimonadota bacterium]